MAFYHSTRFCRWCQVEYIPKKDIGRDGFCCAAHRQALYRARKKALRKRYAGPISSRKDA